MKQVTVMFLVVIVALLPIWPYSQGWGYYPSSTVGLVLVVIIVLVFLGRI